MKQVNWKRFYQEFDNDKKLKIHIQKPKYDNDMAEVVKALKALSKNSYHPKYNNFNSGKSENFNFNVRKISLMQYFSPDSKKQLCAIKFRYSKSKQVHQKYLEHYMVQEDKKEVEKKPELFGNISKDEYLKKMDKSCYKWIISPERNLTEEQLKFIGQVYMTRCEQQLGRKFDWQGAVHLDTEHHHVHLLINGLDQEGKRFKFPKNFLKKGCFDVTSEFLTQMLGERTQDEIAISKEKRLYAERYTNYDSLIEQAQKENNDKEYPYSVNTTDDRLRKRLEFLKDIHLAKFENETFYMSKDWAEVLTASGRYNTFGKARYDYKSNNRELKLYTKDIGKISGKVTRYYNMNDEDVWNNAIIVNDKDGKTAWYVPLYKEGDKYLEQNIELNMRSNQKGLLIPSIRVVKPDGTSGKVKTVKEQTKPIVTKKTEINNEVDGIER